MALVRLSADRLGHLAYISHLVDRFRRMVPTKDA
jgi:hypothetical protein